MDTLIAIADALSITPPSDSRTSFLSLAQEPQDMIYVFALRQDEPQIVDVEAPMPALKCAEPHRSQLFVAYYSCNVFKVQTPEDWDGVLHGPIQQQSFRHIKDVTARICCLTLNRCREHRLAGEYCITHVRLTLRKGQPVVNIIKRQPGPSAEIRFRNELDAPEQAKLIAILRESIKPDQAESRLSGISLLRAAKDFIVHYIRRSKHEDSVDTSYFDAEDGIVREASQMEVHTRVSLCLQFLWPIIML